MTKLVHGLQQVSKIGRTVSGEADIFAVLTDHRTRQGCLSGPNLACRCLFGKTGIGILKREGDGATPIGSWPLRAVLFRPDRMARPTTALPVLTIGPDTGWCDDPNDKRYNRLVKLPYGGHTEALWRGDNIYDLIVVLGYNDAPVKPFRGSAIFLHASRPDLAPTEGCVAISAGQLRRLVGACTPDTHLHVSAAGDCPRGPKIA